MVDRKYAYMQKYHYFHMKHMKFPGKPYTNLTIGNCTSVTNKEGTDGGPHHHIS